jgi:hypothetical protein
MIASSFLAYPSSITQVPTQALTWLKSRLLLSPAEGALTPLYAATGEVQPGCLLMGGSADSCAS